MEVSLNLAGDVKKTKWKVTWLARVCFRVCLLSLSLVC